MSDRSVAAPDDKMKAWMQNVDDQLMQLRSRRLQGALSVESLAISDELTLPEGFALPGLTTFIGKSTAPLALGALFADVPGTTVGVSPGTWLAWGNFDVAVAVAAAGNLAHCIVGANNFATGSFLTGFAKTDNAGVFQTVVSFAKYTFVQNGTLVLQARRTAGTVSIESANGTTGILVVRTGDG